VPDLRYHVVSLIGVFIALSLGLLLGIALAEGDSFESQLRGQVRDIRADLERQRALIAERDEEISSLQERTAEDAEVAQAMSNVLIQDRLEGREVAIVVGPWASSDALRRDLTAAGAEVVSDTELPEPGEEAGPRVLGSLYVEEAREVLRAGGEADPEGTTGTAPGAPGSPDVVVFVGGGEPPAGTTEETLEAVADAEREMFAVWEEAAADGGPRVVAGEASGGERSQVSLYREVGVPSMDNIETPAGRAGLILLAAGDAEGAYGVKDSASDPFPPPPDE
jgi:hypothetical protein